MFVGSLPQMMELVRLSDQATGIAVTGTERSSAVPDLPSLTQAGVPGYELVQWWESSFGTPAEIVTALNAELNRILATTEISAFMTREGAQPTPSTPDALEPPSGR